MTCQIAWSVLSGPPYTYADAAETLRRVTPAHCVTGTATNGRTPAGGAL
jgi:hypothetical protein